MKKVLYIIGGLLVLGLIGYFLYQTLVLSRRSPKDNVRFAENGLEIEVNYSRPYKRGRLIFADSSQQPLLPYGKYWRLGANHATEISFSDDVSFGGKPVSAGTYRMYAVPGSDAFEISLNREVGVSAAHIEPDYSRDVAKIKVPVQRAPVTEQLTISIDSPTDTVRMDIKWDDVLLRIPIVKR
jgi:hypothetical protein